MSCEQAASDHDRPRCPSSPGPAWSRNCSAVSRRQRHKVVCATRRGRTSVSTTARRIKYATGSEAAFASVIGGRAECMVMIENRAGRSLATLKKGGDRMDTSSAQLTIDIPSEPVPRTGEFEVPLFSAQHLRPALSGARMERACMRPSSITSRLDVSSLGASGNRRPSRPAC
jgi:hypothetical protein